MSQGFYGFPNILGLLRATTFKVIGKAGAQNGAALAGGTASGAPVAPAGPFDVGDLIVDATGKLWVCTTAGTSQSSPGSFVQAGGAASFSWATKTSAYTITTSDSGILADATSAGVTITLPTAVGATQRYAIKKKDSSANLVTLATTSSQTIDGFASGVLTFYAQNQCLEVESDGSNWYTVQTSEEASPPAVRCYNTSTTSIANNTTTALTFNTNRYDQGTGVAQHDTASQTSRLTARVAGVYRISASVEFAWSSGQTGQRAAQIRLNGSTNIAVANVPTVASGTGGTNLTPCTSYKLAVGDYVELTVYQDSGGSLNLNASANYSPEFMWERVG